jgi:hypothetical protein
VDGAIEERPMGEFDHADWATATTSLWSVGNALGQKESWKPPTRRACPSTRSTSSGGAREAESKYVARLFWIARRSLEVGRVAWALAVVTQLGRPNSSSVDCGAPAVASEINAAIETNRVTRIKTTDLAKSARSSEVTLRGLRIRGARDAD